MTPVVTYMYIRGFKIRFQDWKNIWRMHKKGKNRKKQITYKEWSVILFVLNLNLSNVIRFLKDLS